MANSSYPARPASARPAGYPPGAYPPASYPTGAYPTGYRAPEPRYLASVPPRRVSFWRDLYNGAVLGDFAREKRLPGALTQIVLGFIPGVGTVCAARDCVADLRYRDLLGFCLNLLALVPVFGGFSKTVEVLINLWHAHHVLRSRTRDGRRQQPQQQATPLPTVPTQPLPQPGQRGLLPPAPRPQTRPYPAGGPRR